MRDCLFALLDDKGTLHAQEKLKKNAAPKALSADIFGNNKKR